MKRLFLLATNLAGTLLRKTSADAAICSRTASRLLVLRPGTGRGPTAWTRPRTRTFGLLWLAGACGLATVLFATLSSHGETNAAGLAEDLALRPPQPELPPSFWEQHGVWLLAAGFLLLVAAVAAIWWWRRPRPSAQLPIEVQTRQALEVLRQQAENGQILSQTSRWVRRYMTVAFELPPEEMTTAEFCKTIQGQQRIGNELANAVCDFLRRCDELKFAPVAASPPFGAAARALELVQLGETRRGQLRQTIVAQTETQPLRSHG